MRTIEHKNIPSGGGGGTGFNQVQLMYTLQVCEYDEEKEKKEKQQKKDTLPVFYRVLPSVRASRVIIKLAGVSSEITHHIT